nr:IucA/IucC family protein [Corynebacterium lactis]
MSQSVYINSSNCEAEISRRLVDALRSERLLDTGKGAEQRCVALVDSNEAPAELLRQLAREGLLTVEATNLDRACAEIADSVVGLQRARQGIADRWEAERLAGHSAGRAGTYSELIEALRRRCAPRDRSPSALLARCEQLVCDGHPASPAAKTSLGIGDYWPRVLPEQTETLPLRFAAVAPGRSRRPGRRRWQPSASTCRSSAPTSPGNWPAAGWRNTRSSRSIPSSGTTS